MQKQHHSRRTLSPSLPFFLLVGLLAILWLAGGAARADVLGQAIVRMASWAALLLFVLFGTLPNKPELRPVVILMLAAVGLVLLQSIALPPAIWRMLPGRPVLEGAALVSNQAASWRPLAIVPDAAVNALSSLVVPCAVLLLAMGLREDERKWLPGIVLGLIVAASVIGLLQLSGAGLNHPFINDTPGQMGGNFANRNHFALFLAIGCLIAPVWAFSGNVRRTAWRAPVAIALVVLFSLTILASGSRGGVLVGLLSLPIVMLLAKQGIRHELRRAPRWVFPAIAAAIFTIIAIFVLFSVAADRAISIERFLLVDQGQDMRTRGLPVVLSMIATYFPVGSGFGGFDPIFRMHEPASLLKLTYFNHAHNDFLEVALDGGLMGIALLLSAIGWWSVASLRAWRTGGAPARLGSAILLLVLIASAFDYPARTPMMMAMIILAAVWLAEPGQGTERRALPRDVG
jgi:O-antigen ligase